MLTIENLTFSYGEVLTLRGVELEIPTGKVACVMGRNGVGKTTLLKNIVGLLKPSAGSISLDGNDVTALPAYRRSRSGMALVPQGRMIFPKLSVEENLRVGLEARSDRARKIPGEVYDLFPVLKDMGRRRGGDLSGGQQQQLAIGRALVGKPRILLLDEPTEGIQPNIIQQIGRVLLQLVEQMHMTIVLVEQYVDFVKEFGHTFHVMNRGQVIVKGTTDELTPEIVHRHLSV